MQTMVHTGHVLRVFEFLRESGNQGVNIGRVVQDISPDLIIYNSECPDVCLKKGSVVLFKHCSTHNPGMVNIAPMIEEEVGEGDLIEYNFPNRGLAIGVPSRFVLDFLEW